MVIWKKLILGLVLLLALSAVHASDIGVADDSQESISVDNLALEDISDDSQADINVSDSVLEVPHIPDVPDEPDVNQNKTIYITPENIATYFKDSNLEDDYDNKVFVFEGTFSNLGKLSINAQNITIKGEGAVFKNTVFDICRDNVSMSNLKFDLDCDLSDNDGAVIIFNTNNIYLDNLDINYNVPYNCEAYAICGVGDRMSSRNLRLTNSKINFEGHNNDINVYNCAIKVINYEDYLMENNTITTSLPLKDVNHGAHGTSLDSDFVLSVGVENCNKLRFINNTIISEVNYRQDSLYPTLDGLLISKCDNALIANNSIHMSDFITYPGLDNYLYGMDIYNLNNLTVVNNDISIVTTGGRLAAGTAYPIQISGPISKVNITRNDLYSFSNGPNIGIYSQNYYGNTELSITYNRINVTGLAGTHEWALVAGVETQDSNSTVENNIIEVHSVGPVNIDDNIYGVSYRQSTDGDHTYSIQNNTVFSDGYKSVYLLDSKDSTVANNLLVSYNENAKNGYDGFSYGDLSRHDNINFQNNQVIRAFDYFANLNNNLDNGEEYSYITPVNNKGISNVIDGSGINPVSNNNKPVYNPIIPGTSSQNSEMYTQTIIDNPTGHSDGDRKINEDKGSSNNNNGADNGISHNNGNSNSYSNSSSQATTAVSSDIVSNNTDATPSDAGTQSLVGGSQSGGGSSGVSKKAYEIEDLTKSEFIPSIFYVIAALILIIAGYKRKNSNFD
ncbi:right-handed parallel beta-helix repeat-containing protein [Methanobrevibacter sp.]|uniref:right-handed parallel beta-helix repeat-containing protein n=1 Tax=Methanobrevibacter sp. TaxID=66852 RepID=UPI002E76E52D|nr:right-handed parallel beta-helix repeat-containing protein [Methanobrevibacter sp.]MEE1335458.1 right-handed parallel beta-helix repeat-containing protein [Methanobrevibacter sp.]